MIDVHRPPKLSGRHTNPLSPILLKFDTTTLQLTLIFTLHLFQVGKTRGKKNRKKHRARTFTGKFTFISDERKLRALFKSNFTIIGFKVCPSRVPKSQSVIGNGNKTSISIDIRKCQTILSGKKLQYLFNMGEGGGFPIILLMTLLAHCDEILQGVQVLFSRY